MSPRTVLTTLACVSLWLGTTGCFGHSSYQSARVVEPGKPQATIAGARTVSYDNGFSQGEWWTFEFMARHSIASRADMGMKISTLHADGAHSVTMGLDWKCALVENYLAADLGLGMIVPAPQTIHLSPGVIATLPLTPHLDVNASAKTYMLPFTEWDGPLFAYSFGLGIKLGDSGFGLRPEVSVLTPGGPGEDWVQFGVGIDLPRVAEKPGNPWNRVSDASF